MLNNSTAAAAGNTSISARQANMTIMYGTSLLESEPLQAGIHTLVIQPNTNAQDSGRNVVLLDYISYNPVDGEDIVQPNSSQITMTVTSTVLPLPTGSQPSPTPSTLPPNKSKSHAIVAGASLVALIIVAILSSLAFYLFRRRRARINLETARPWVPLASETTEAQPLIAISAAGHTQHISTSTFNSFQSDKSSLGQTRLLQVPSSDSNQSPADTDAELLRQQIAQLEQEVLALRASHSPPSHISRFPRLRPPLPPQTPPVEEAIAATLSPAELRVRMSELRAEMLALHALAPVEIDAESIRAYDLPPRYLTPPPPRGERRSRGRFGMFGSLEEGSDLLLEEAPP